MNIFYNEYDYTSGLKLKRSTLPMEFVIDCYTDVMYICVRKQFKWVLDRMNENADDWSLNSHNKSNISKPSFINTLPTTTW